MAHGALSRREAQGAGTRSLVGLLTEDCIMLQVSEESLSVLSPWQDTEYPGCGDAKFAAAGYESLC